MDLTDQFLVAYAEDKLGWEGAPDTNAIARRLCEEYFYTPDPQYMEQGDREFLMIALGWMWAKTSYTTANCHCAILMLKMSEMWNIVAKENNWTFGEMK